MIKKFLSFIFGDLGLAISAVLCTTVGGLLFPVFTKSISAGLLSKILGWALVFPLTIGFLLSAVGSAFTLLCRAAKQESKIKKIVYVVIALLTLAGVVAVTILNALKLI